MRTRRIIGCALAAALGATGLSLGGTPAGAAVEGTLVTCSTGTGDIGDAKFAPGLTTVEKKQTISGSFDATGCSASEAELDEIAAESKFGVTKTVAGGRPSPLAKANAKFKFTTYGDCLGLVLADPDDTGEYLPWGTVTLTFTTASGAKVATASVFATLTAAGASATVEGIVTKGLGVGGEFVATASFSPVATDDTNGNTSPDFVDCALAGDPTAVGKIVDVVAPATLSVTLPTTP